MNKTAVEWHTKDLDDRPKAAQKFRDGSPTLLNTHVIAILGIAFGVLR